MKWRGRLQRDTHRRSERHPGVPRGDEKPPFGTARSALHSVIVMPTDLTYENPGKSGRHATSDPSCAHFKPNLLTWSLSTPRES